VPESWPNTTIFKTTKKVMYEKAKAPQDLEWIHGAYGSPRNTLAQPPMPVVASAGP